MVAVEQPAVLGQARLGDIGVVTHIFHPDKVPLYGVSFNTPFSSIDPMVVTKTIDMLVNSAYDGSSGMTFKRHSDTDEP